MADILREFLYACVVITWLIPLLKWEIFQVGLIQKIKTKISGSKNFKANRDVYETMWKNMMQPDKPQIRL